MEILLIGEFSRLHNSLKEGLSAHGHNVTICGLGDGFKDFPVDWPVYKKWDQGWRKKARLALMKLSGFDLSSWLTYRQFQKYVPQLHQFDVIQLINENSFLCAPYFEHKILEAVFATRAKVFLLSCGNDYPYVTYSLAHPEEKSVLQPYLQGKLSADAYEAALKFTRPDFKKLHEYIYDNIKGVIATDFDYVAPLQNHPKFLGLIPNPVNIDKLQPLPLPNPARGVIIFHGVNRSAYYKKGNDVFDAALEVIAHRYANRVEILRVESLPYAQYIRQYDRAHILLDQCYAKDQGYNALEAMAKAKVVFTGAETEFLTHYHLHQPVNVNAVAQVEAIVSALSNLIENPDEITAMGQRARDFIVREHDFKCVAQRYLDVWDQA